MEARPVVFDTDPGIDDAFALALALASPELDLRLVTTVFGNTDIASVTRNAGLLLSALDAPDSVTLARGNAAAVRGPRRDARYFHGIDGLGGAVAWLQKKHITARKAQAQGVQKLVHAARTFGRDLTVIAVGPLTNIARALVTDPAAMSTIGQLIVMGGAVRVPGNVSAGAEFNFYADPAAAALVLDAHLPLTLVPLDVTTQVRCSPTLIRTALAGRRDLRASLLRRMAKHTVSRQAQGFALHDPLAVAIAVHADLVETEQLPLQVLSGSDAAQGITLEDRRDRSESQTTGALTRVALRVDADRALALFAERVFGVNNIASKQVPQTPAQVIAVGGANVDLVVHTRTAPRLGETVTGDALTQVAGGKGANQAVAACRAGAQVSFIGTLGNDPYGQSLNTALATEGIDLRGVSISTQASGVALITVDAQGQNQITVAPGANWELDADALDQSVDFWQGARVLLIQFEVPMAAVLHALRRARKLGIRTIVNPSPIRKSPRSLAPLVDVLVPNEVEAQALSGQAVTSIKSAYAALDRLAVLGFHCVVLTLGARGVVWSHACSRGHCKALKCKAVDTTAAGDTFTGYLSAALAQDQPLPSAIEFANRAAALSVQRHGAQPSIPYRHELST